MSMLQKAASTLPTWTGRQGERYVGMMIIMTMMMMIDHGDCKGECDLELLF